MDEETLLLEVETGMEEAVEHMQAGFAGVRTGKASPSLVDNMDIFVASYGSSMKLKSLAVVSTPDARSVRLPIPELTGERRKELCKYVSGLGEETRVRIRGVRKTGMDGIKKMKADNILTEDGVRTAEDKVQKLTDKYVKTVGDLVAAKENEIMTV